jgi:sulfotransferase family protein
MQENIQHPDISTLESKFCFILGVQRRSGTNYIFRLLREHPDCMGLGPITEDFFVYHTELLKKYTHRVYHSWHSKSEVKKKISSSPQETLLRYFGDAICRFLRLQITAETPIQPASNQGPTEEIEPKILLTKTPSVVGIGNFFDFFPDAYLIIIIRDGRAVVESGVRSFDWNYEDATQVWKSGAHAILDLKRKHQNSNNKLLIVRYEDLFTDEKTELHRIFDFLSIAPKKFHFDHTKDLGITGSSETKKQADAVHWQVTDKTKEFKPLERFSNWDKKKHERFNWIAGRYMSKFGYDLEATTSNRYLYVIRNRFLDTKWILRKIFLAYFKIVTKLATGDKKFEFKFWRH